MTTMTTVYQQFLADLSARVKAGTTTAEDIAWLTEATVKLGGSAAAEQEMLAAVNKALSTGEANLTAATTAAETATTAFNAQTTNLNLIPTLKQAVTNELQKVPVAVDATTRRHYTIQSRPLTMIFENRTDSYFFRNGCQNILQMDDFDTGEYYAAFDMSDCASASPPSSGHVNYSACKSHLVHISRDGVVSHYAKKCRLNTRGKAIAFIPTTDNTVRLLTVSGSSLAVHNHMKINDAALHQAYDYEKFYVTAQRELLCVSGGKLVTIRHDGATVDNDTTFADYKAFYAWADQRGHKHLPLNSNGTYSPASFGYMVREDNDNRYRLSYNSFLSFYSHAKSVQCGFSQQHGLQNLPLLKTGNITARAAARLSTSDQYNAKGIVFGASAEYPLSPFTSRMPMTISILLATCEGNHNSWLPQIIGFSAQHRALLYKFYERPDGCGGEPNFGTIGIDFGV